MLEKSYKTSFSSYTMFLGELNHFYVLFKSLVQLLILFVDLLKWTLIQNKIKNMYSDYDFK